MVSAPLPAPLHTHSSGNFLTNLTPEGMTPLLGAAVALPLALAVRLGYAVSLAASTVLVMFPLRQAAMVGGSGLRGGGLHGTRADGCSCWACGARNIPRLRLSFSGSGVQHAWYTLCR